MKRILVLSPSLLLAGCNSNSMGLDFVSYSAYSTWDVIGVGVAGLVVGFLIGKFTHFLGW